MGLRKPSFDRLAYHMQRYNIGRGACPSLADIQKKYLKIWWEVDAVVFTDVAHGLGRQFLGLWRDAHGIEDRTTCGQIATESAG